MDDEPLTWWSSSSRVGHHRDLNVEEVYRESHRLAVEHLVAGGVDAYMGFLKKERVQNFLSDDEIKFILKSAVVPESTPQPGDARNCVVPDATSLVYFPDVSDIIAPSLDIGWSAIAPGSSRGVTTATAHFQPNYFVPNIPVECIYSCKEAARKMIKGAKEVIAIVTDALTDVDIFRDLQEACMRRRVPVYILLDIEAVPSFLQMCSNLNVRLSELQKMRVRAVAGFRYFTRSGARITGRIHEQFMLIDGTKAAMGTYRFRWTDGRINTCNLIELTGDVVEQYEVEFQRLYKKSLVVNPKAVLSPPVLQASTPSPVCVKVAPSRAQALGVVLSSLTPAANVTPPGTNPPVSRPTSCSTSTQTLSQSVTQGTQTDHISSHRPCVLLSSSSLEDSSGSESACSTHTEVSQLLLAKTSLLVKPCPTPTPSILKLSGPDLSKDPLHSQHNAHPPSNFSQMSQYNRINHLDCSSPSLRSGVDRGCKIQQYMRPGRGLTMGSMLMDTTMRSRFLQ
ncbi:protein FAM83D-like [Alosa sapidissima]|uniref:protein FAM83D-like n=1 Tax=Alosa sapidissima TaxID=34773 RepID=UPI001C087314|nr:protein FAM83D-like [Alosa sapidissima]